MIPSLDIKDKYVPHRKNLQLHSSIGMKLLSVHRILKFKQSDWLKKLILILILERMLQIALKNISRLVNNNVYGKRMKNLRK